MEQTTESKETQPVWSRWAKAVAIVDIIVFSIKLGFLLLTALVIVIIASGVNLQNLQGANDTPNYTENFYYNDPSLDKPSASVMAVTLVIIFVCGLFTVLQLWAAFKLLTAVNTIQKKSETNSVQLARTWIHITVIIFVIYLGSSILPLLINHSFVLILISTIWRASSLFIVKKFVSELQEL